MLLCLFIKVPPGSPRSPPIVFAVMANPEVLKDSGRHSKDPEERRAMVELMCDFVEAMNPGVKLVRYIITLLVYCPIKNKNKNICNTSPETP